MIINPCESCGEQEIEWADMYCQKCWEAECCRAWWEMVSSIKDWQVEMSSSACLPEEID
jgi:hypothetical protein